MAKIISIHSFRGGTGKSNITANVAVQIARQGYRVGVVDTDINSPGIHVLFRMDEEDIDHALNDYLWGRCEIEDAAYDVSAKVGKGEIILMAGGVYLISSSMRIGEITRILRDGYDVGLLNQGFQTLIDRLALDYLFIDTHPGVNEETLLSITLSDLLIVILRTDQQDFQGTAVTVDVANKLNVPHLCLVVNKAISIYDPVQLKKTVEQTYDAPVAAIIPLSEDVAALQSAAIFSLRYPDHPITREIQKIATFIEAEI
ncbi:MAG TPA: MinD/ParA family protein [Chloroflexi bacterium]|nr:MinD/ParA family protein [Chloroflexota bacterium]